MKTEAELRSLVSIELMKLASKVAKEFGSAPVITTTFNVLRGGFIGRAWGDRTIDVNTPAALALGWERYRETVVHEYGHIIAVWVYKNNPSHWLVRGHVGRGHGQAWKNVMNFLGQAPERTYSAEDAQVLASAGALGSTYSYACTDHPEKIYPFSQRRHNNVILRGMTYICPCCKKTLVHLK